MNRTRSGLATRTRILVATVALALGLAACTSTSPQIPHAPVTAVQPDPCEKPASIEAYCAARSCSTYEESVAHARHEAQGDGMFRYEIGTCGSFRYLQTQEGMGFGTDYFDAAGKLAATEGLADAPRCDGEFASRVGVIPACDRQVIERGEAHFDR